jgi:hypothetical protein
MNSDLSDLMQETGRVALIPRHPDRSRAERGEVEGPIHAFDEDKVPPLRFATVGMTVGG